MNFTLTPEDQRFIEEQIETGRFSSAADVVGAALARLRDDTFDFGEGELAVLIAEGEADVEKGNLIPADEVFGRLKEKAAQFRMSNP